MVLRDIKPSSALTLPSCARYVTTSPDFGEPQYCNSAGSSVVSLISPFWLVALLVATD
ncbi:hypothetical protein B0H17DRAFT_1332255, partial [Mycena rosella]